MLVDREQAEGGSEQGSATPHLAGSGRSPAADRSGSRGTPFPRRTLAQRIWYDLLKLLSRTGALAALRIRCYGTARVPKQGAALVLVNHQSHLDPIIVGAVCDRRMNYLARESLFRFFLFRWLIRSLDAIPIDREGSGLSGLKETLRRLKRGEVVVLFPEGTRSSDGEIGHLKPGFGALARRARVPLLPVAIDGSFEAWPRSRRFPRPGTVVVEFGRPIAVEEIAGEDDRALVTLVEQRLREAHRRARRRRMGPAARRDGSRSGNDAPTRARAPGKGRAEIA